ncbi:MAG: VOC family protein [Oligoflexia bacterium]|nr:VOC family protein [Oligoflexia bacterium]
MNTSTRLSHVEINVSQYAKSIKFYDLILFPLGWKRFLCTTDCTVYCDGFLKIILSPAADKYKNAGFHRKRIGLNHIALYANSKKEVDIFYDEILKKNSIASLYQDGPDGNENYYSVLFEDPDRMKIEVVFAPKYCDKECWPNNLVNNFDPYKAGH